MDNIDRRIIGELQRDGRISVTELSDRVDLSLSATSERLRRLRSSGVIAGFTVLVDPDAAGRTIQALIDVRLPASGSYSAGVDAALAELDAVVDAVHLTGPFDTQLRIAARDVAELDHVLAVLKDELGVQETNTRLILRTIEGFPRAPGV
jgi:Lrp/AsnC family leucine-responsive transcriptional regulator